MKVHKTLKKTRTTLTKIQIPITDLYLIERKKKAICVILVDRHLYRLSDPA